MALLEQAGEQMLTEVKAWEAPRSVVGLGAGLWGSLDTGGACEWQVQASVSGASHGVSVGQGFLLQCAQG